jgi:2'-5' RNA ligase
MSALRTFLAIELPEETRARISKLQKELVRCGVSVKWVEKDNLHLTMRFFGDLEEERLEDVKKAVGEAAKKLVPIEAKLEGLGAFPTLKRPRVVWLGVSDGRRGILEMKETLEKELEIAGFPLDEGRFSAHVTLGRVRDRSARVTALSREVERAEFPAAEVLVKEISCMKSDLTRTGPIYSKLFGIALGLHG